MACLQKWEWEVGRVSASLPLSMCTVTNRDLPCQSHTIKIFWFFFGERRVRQAAVEADSVSQQVFNRLAVSVCSKVEAEPAARAGELIAVDTELAQGPIPLPEVC